MNVKYVRQTSAVYPQWITYAKLVRFEQKKAIYATIIHVHSSNEIETPKSFTCRRYWAGEDENENIYFPLDEKEHFFEEVSPEVFEEKYKLLKNNFENNLDFDL